MNVKRAFKFGLCLCAAVGAADDGVVGHHATVSLRRVAWRDSLRLSGIIAEDPTRTREVTARVDGRVETLFAAYRERWIRKGETLLTLYSPDLATAQSDYLLLLGGAEGPLRSARERLLAMGFSEEDILKLKSNRKPIALLSVFSTVSGYALEFAPGASSAPVAGSKSGMGMEGMGSTAPVSAEKSPTEALREGMHVVKGQTLFRLNDLRKVWVLLSVSAGETTRLNTGLSARIRVQGAGDFSGHIAFVDPYYPENSRSVQARVVLENPEGRMRIGALAEAVVWPPPDSAWILSRSAVVDLGERKIVWVRLPGDSTRFQARSVVIGRAGGGNVEVLRGISPQDAVAKNGAYLYDSENFIRPEAIPDESIPDHASMGHAMPNDPSAHADHSGMKMSGLTLLPEQEAMAGIRTQKARRKKIAPQIVLTAAVRRSEVNRVLVSSHASGRMLKLSAPIPGQTVRMGQPFFTLYSEEMAAAALEYRMALESKASVASAERRLRLYGLTSGQIRKLDRAGMDTAFTILAPRGGIVQNILAREGRNVNPGDPLFEILDLDTVWLEAFAFPEDFPFLVQRKSVEIRFDAYPDETAQGVLFHLPAGRPEGAAGMIHARVRNPELRYRPGMAAKVFIRLEEREALTVEKSALIRSRSDLLWVRSAPHTYSQRMVVLGIEEGAMVEVLDGLMEGEDVVISGAYLLKSENIIRNGANAMQGMKH